MGVCFLRLAVPVFKSKAQLRMSSRQLCFYIHMYYIYIYKYVCIHIYIYTYTHIYIYIHDMYVDVMCAPLPHLHEPLSPSSQSLDSPSSPNSLAWQKDLHSALAVARLLARSGLAVACRCPKMGEILVDAKMVFIPCVFLQRRQSLTLASP